MKNNCNLLIISILCTLISILLIEVFYLCECNRFFSLLLNISIGIFTSAIVTLILNLSSYLSSKTYNLKKYYETYNKKIINISKIEYYNCDVNNDTFLGFLNEKRHNEICKEFGFKSRPENKFRDRIIDELYLNNVELYKNENVLEVKKRISKNLDNWLNKELESIDNILHQYQDCAKILIYDLKEIIGDFKFLISDKTKMFIINSLHDPLCDFLSRIREFEHHISLYFNGKGNQYIVIEMLFDYQNNFIFEVEKKQHDNFEFVNVYFKWIDDINVQLEKLRTKIYKDMLRIDKSLPILSYSKKFDKNK